MASVDVQTDPEPDDAPDDASDDRVQLQLWGASERVNGLLRHAPTVRGQFAGVVLLMVPALAHPLSLGRAHGLVQILAAVAGATGAVLLFGGLALRLLDPRVVAAKARGRSLDNALCALPHAREIWTALALLGLALAAGAVACLVRAFAGDVADRLGEVLLLGLPAAALAAIVWRARAMRLGTVSADLLSQP